MGLFSSRCQNKTMVRIVLRSCNQSSKSHQSRTLLIEILIYSPKLFKSVSSGMVKLIGSSKQLGTSIHGLE